MNREYLQKRYEEALEIAKNDEKLDCHVLAIKHMISLLRNENYLPTVTDKLWVDYFLNKNKFYNKDKEVLPATEEFFSSLIQIPQIEEIPLDRVRYTFEHTQTKEVVKVIFSIGEIDGSEKRGVDYPFSKVLENYKNGGYVLIKREAVKCYTLFEAMKMCCENPNLEFEDRKQVYFLKYCMGQMKTCKQNQGYYSEIEITEDLIKRRWYLIEKSR